MADEKDKKKKEEEKRKKQDDLDWIEWGLTSAGAADKLKDTDPASKAVKPKKDDKKKKK